LESNKINFNEVMLKSDNGNKVDFSYDDYKNSLKVKKPELNTNMPNSLIPSVQTNRPGEDKNFSYNDYIKQNAKMGDSEIKNAEIRSDVNRYLNFGLKQDENKDDQGEQVHNPYASLAFTDFQPVYKTGLHATTDFNSFNNQFSNQQQPRGLSNTLNVNDVNLPNYSEVAKGRNPYNNNNQGFPKL
jgi:hypothetical protein